tara:strand:- start:146 stop:502 length:357 start_codon:yes stop_codon:yes gene_type:complete
MFNNTNIDSNNKEIKKEESFLLTFIAAFVTVFLAELGDKTQIATLLLSAESGKPFLVFIGASLALICSSLISVIIGSWLSEKLPENLLNNIAGVLMCSIGIYLILEVLKIDIYFKQFL